MPTIIGKVIEEKQLTQDQARGLRLRAARRRKPVQDLLIEEGLVGEEEFFNTALSVFAGPVIDRQEEIVDASCAGLIPYSLAKRYGVFPVRKEAKGLLLAMSNPHDLSVLEDIRFVTEFPLNPALCTKSQITEFLKQYYVNSESVRELLEKAESNSAYEEEGSSFSDEDRRDISETDDEESDLLQFVNRLIADAVDARASDIHIEPQDRTVNVRYRLDGQLKNVVDFKRQFLDRVISRIKILAKLDIAEKRKFQDGRISVWMYGRKIDLRVSIIPVYHGEKAVVRILDTEHAVFSFDEIEFGPEDRKVFSEAITRPQGVVLLTGPTGSGKTTTIYSALGHIKSETRNIVTVEDPVEYLIEGTNQVQLNRIKEITFANCLRSILRQDPDVLFIGEIRDKETAEIAFQASLTGHLVFSSLHTNNSAASITRLMDIGLEPYLIASAVSLIVSQRLVRRVCPHCQTEYTPERWLLERFQASLKQGFVRRFVKGEGCRSCHFTGYKGRLPIFEMLRVTPEIRSLISHKMSETAIHRQAVKDGMKTLAQTGVEKVARGLTTLEELAKVADVVETQGSVSIADLVQEKYLVANEVPERTLI